MPGLHMMSLVVITMVSMWAVAWAQEGKSEREKLTAVVQSVQQLLETGKAIETLREVWHAETKTVPSPKQIVDFLSHLVVDTGRAGAYELGLALAQQAQAYAEEQLGAEHPSTLTSLNNLAFLYKLQGRYGEAEPLLQHVLTARERVLGAEHPDTLASLNNLAVVYQIQGRYGEAELLYQDVLATSERVLGAEHPDTLTSLSNLADFYKSQGRYGEAEPLYQRALTPSERVLGAEHPDTLSNLNNLAHLYESQGRYGEAEPLYQRALATRERVLGAEHPDTLTSLNNLAHLYESQGRYGEAEPLYQRALATRERVLGAEHPDTLTSLNNLAHLYKLQGRYGEAELLYQHAVAAFVRVLGAEHPKTLLTLNNVAGVWQAQGRYGEAELLYQDVLATSERVLGAEHSDTLLIVHNLAFVYQMQGRYGEAEPLLQRVLTTRERVLGAEHPDTLTSLNNLAHLYESQGRYGEAEPLLQHVLTARERVLGAEHPDTLASLNNLALVYQRQGRYGEAEPLLQRALATSEHALGAEHPQTLEAQMTYVVLLINRDRPQDALQQLKLLEPRLLAFAGVQLHTTLQERVRRDFLFSHSSFQDIVFTLAIQRRDLPEFRAFAADVLLRWKQVQRDEDAFLAGLLRTSTDAVVTRLGQEIKDLRRGISHLTHSPQADPASLYAKHRALDVKEAELARYSPQYKRLVVVRELQLKDVRTHLPQDSALLELRVYSPADFKTGKRGSRHWLALLFSATERGEQDLVLHDLGPVTESRQLWEALRQHDDCDTATRLYQHLFGPLDERLQLLYDLGPVVESEKLWAALCRYDNRKAATRLYQHLFGPLDELLQSFKTLYIAPDDFVHLVGLARLVLPDGRYWMERQILRQLQTGRDLIPDMVDKSPPTGLLALGGIDYDHFEDDTMTMADPHQHEMPRKAIAILGPFKSLRNSGMEAKGVSVFYWDEHESKVDVWQDRKASETRLKTLSAPPRVLHLATHGFYLSHPKDESERPMTLSGLALAGANQGMQEHLNVSGDDGLLYALEVQYLNLEGTELVALSACKTGQGEVDYTEGVYGLVRAFRIAGARRVLMTLSNVDDAYTKTFMLRFYANWLTPARPELNPNRDPVIALQQTRLEFLTDKDPALREPRVWAPYVLVEMRRALKR